MILVVGALINPTRWLPTWLPDLINIVDIGLVLLLTYMVLLLIGERRALWMVRGLIILMVAAVVSNHVGLQYFSFVLERLVLGSAVAMAIIFQAEFRQFLEQLGRGNLLTLLLPTQRLPPRPDNVIDEIVDAIKTLSQSRTGALLVLEIGAPIDERFFSVSGVELNAELSTELLQTIFQTTTLLHDGAVHIRGSRILAAGIILPLSERIASRQLGTRHRAAMGITERVKNCVCIVVSEETGSISLARELQLNRPLTSSKLRELLQNILSPPAERDSVGRLSRRLGSQSWDLIQRVLRIVPASKGE
ncbi:MAG: diadenylate cyclase CdaA [Spirulinaceae cyanobacterium]